MIIQKSLPVYFITHLRKSMKMFTENVFGIFLSKSLTPLTVRFEVQLLTNLCAKYIMGWLNQPVIYADR